MCNPSCKFWVRPGVCPKNNPKLVLFWLAVLRAVEETHLGRSASAILTPPVIRKKKKKNLMTDGSSLNSDRHVKEDLRLQPRLSSSPLPPNSTSWRRDIWSLSLGLPSTLEWAEPPLSSKYRGLWHGGVNSHLIITAINDRIMATRDGRGDCNRAEGADITCWHVVAVWWESQLSTSPLVFFFFSSTAASSAAHYTHHHHTTTTCLIISRTVI